MKVFVTVGTTRFDALIEAMFQADIQEALLSKGITSMTIQAGNSAYLRGGGNEDDSGDIGKFAVDLYSYKSSLVDDVNGADLIICHAGAGSITEALGAEKPTIVVINDQLMNNHQSELARRLCHDGYLTCCYPRQLADTIHSVNMRRPGKIRYEAGSAERFFQYLSGQVAIDL